ncbi:hypothetical protein [Granulicella arctica]|uniref:Glycosyltransferase RgtA/B/C/D-like domain-containing protein n=1 Tax=Granulicella arctica TaxID=940613 RepID=A0A7Y9PEK3_9BACT|nr:hypothetical protein [Granulicella arctica]NYF78470.1 hypothetical protein [Granulicella arctica]
MTEYRAEDRHRNDVQPEAEPFILWLRRLWPFFCALAVVVTFGYALYDKYQIDGDAVAYMDIGDLLRSHQWAGAVNAYWNPLYPAALALGHIVFHATRYTELHAYYMTNFGIFLLEMVAVVAFTDSIIRLRTARETANTGAGIFLLERYALRYIGVGLLLIATQRELSLGKVRPDALLQALLLLGLAALLNHLATGLLRYAALMGVALGLAYLTKSFAFLFTLLCILALVAFRWIWQRHAPVRALVAGGLAFVCFALVAGPYIAALSKQKGHFDFGDSGALNYAWYVGGTEKMHLQPYQTSQFGSAEVRLKHPEKELLHAPQVFSYKLLPYGTYPDWFDATFWNDSIKPHNTLRGEIPRVSRNVVLVFRYIFNHPEGWILLGLLIFLGSRLRAGWRPTANAFWLTPILLGLGIWGIYGMVNIEERYVTIGYLALVLPLFAMLQVSPAAEAVQRPTGIFKTASVLALLFALLFAGESGRTVLDLRRYLSAAGSPGGWYDAEMVHTAQALNALGVGPGDTIACIGYRACLDDHYWARLAGVRILTEVYDTGEVYPFLAGLGNRDKMFDVVRQQGGKVLVGHFAQPGEMTGTTPASAGWHELADTHFYEFPLNLPAQGVPTPAMADGVAH